MFEVLVQMAGLILCGLGWRLFKPAGLEPVQTRKVLTSLVYYLLLPALVLSVLWSAPLGLDSVRIVGTVTNEQPFKLKNPIVIGVLLDASGQMVSLGYTYVTVEDIEPGASVPFDLRVETRPYVRYTMYAQAERDWR